MLYFGDCVRNQEEFPHGLPYFVAKLRYFGKPVVYNDEFPMKRHYNAWYNNFIMAHMP